MTDDGGQVASGWYADPVNPGLQRYWDGVAWTSATAPIAPLGGAAPLGHRRRWFRRDRGTRAARGVRSSVRDVGTR